MIRRLLIANRGEIACRIVRTAGRMGIETVAIYSDADREALHVESADLAVRVGPTPAAQSYMNISAILAAARTSGADAVHPGYGFLSENADFAAACQAAGLIWVGPSAEAIAAMGDKAGARRLMMSEGVPVVPGYDGEEQSDQRLVAEAERVGFPLLIKAVSGGGGRGMRRVPDAAGFQTALESARREALAACGDGRVILEKLIVDARHIEVQVLGDRYGNIIHLAERDCSTQRRHQKVIEEQPSPFVSDDLRIRLTAAAISAARAVTYEGAGTVEFIVGEDGGFHFLEMNTRLQVEHPVTEMVTGLDLVEWQIRIAQGEALPPQETVCFEGHAIEARLYAEDPNADYAPQTGRISYWRPRAALALEGVRVDAGIREGDVVSPFYDPMVAKLIAHGQTRAQATARLAAALRASPLLGVRNNAGQLLSILSGESFAEGGMTTGRLDAEPASLRDADPIALVLAAMILCLAPGGDWFRSSGRAETSVTLVSRSVAVPVDLVFDRSRLVSAAAGGASFRIEEARIENGRLRCKLDGNACSVLFALDKRQVWLFHGDEVHGFSEPDPLARAKDQLSGGSVVAPLAGVVSSIEADIGDMVAAGQTVATIEAMKMETRLVAGIAGTVMSVEVAVGRQVQAGDPILLIEAAGEA
ncbi:carbamoyl-phosphate synthase subunit L [Chelativorans sp. ZYF759]|uniref:acetyl/propionyl/methylcrotonyl-CoA carboxylase subunit alpha n=1 Tax=Chelativorans sp. ZYF759 TaxID=2692213 RepID=UPI00145DAFBF|nr:biotin carboxylase N-terminal domain-containing protein [Chelativorans sp. ZYF759]NMG40307.1 carbamoyl-phosphate synthase subunit L [Chelativorans sp. ZYF759]